MKPRHIVAVTILGAMLILAGGGCRREVPPDRPSQASGPDRTWTGIPTTYTVSAHIDRGTIRFVTDWGDLVDTTGASYASGETATITHVWAASGLMPVKVQAINSAAPGKASSWSWPESVDVIPDSVPVVDTVEAPPLVMRGVEVHFTIRASDPDGDSIKVHIEWGDGKDTTTEFHRSSPYYFGFYPDHSFTQVETAKVVVIAQDGKGAASLPETTLVRIDTTGGVIWYSAAPAMSPLVVNDGVEDCVYFTPWPPISPGAYSCLALTTAGDYKYDGPCLSAAAYCAVTQHIVGWGGGLLALDRQLHVVWRLETPESTGWGDPAVNGNRIYVGNDNDSLYCFIDSVDHGGRIPAFAARGAIVDAPAVDAQWAVYFGTDSGYLYKVGPWLDTTFWRVHLAGYKIHSPIVGSDGTIYCASESQTIYAVDPATGTTIWTIVLDGQAFRPVVGQTAIFVGTSASKVYSIDPSTGGINWVKVLGYPNGFSTAPVIAADGYVYFLSDNEVLYRVSQAGGDLDWECDCGYFGGGYGLYTGIQYPGKRMPSIDYTRNSTILPNGNVIVAGINALYCVAGSHTGPLDPLAPWPKWQHDLHNTGRVGGGR